MDTMVEKPVTTWPRAAVRSGPQGDAGTEARDGTRLNVPGGARSGSGMASFVASGSAKASLASARRPARRGETAMIRRGTWCLLLVLALMLAVPGALASEEPGSAPVRGGTLIVGVDQEAIGLDPNIVTAFSSRRRVELMYNRLVRYDASAAIVPDLARAWEIPDPTTYIFHLHEGVTFHNGREVTAEDVKYTIERILAPETGSPVRSFLLPIEEIVVRDRYTIELRLTAPTASMLDALSFSNMAIVPREVIEEHGDLQRVAVGTGPFQLDRWVADQETVFVRNPDYFEDDLPYIDRLVFRVIPDQMSLLAGLRTGSLQAAQIDDAAVLSLAERDPNLEVLSTPAILLRVFSFNVAREPFDDPRVRQAMALAMDRDEIIRVAEFGRGLVSAPIPSSAETWAAPIDTLPNYTPDLERARELLEEAGVPQGARFDIVTSPTYEGGLAVAEIIQEQLRRIGLDPRLEVVEWGIYIDKWVNRDFDTMIELRSGGGDPDTFLHRLIHSQGAVNNFQYANAELDALLDTGRHLVAFDERHPIYLEAQHILAQEVPYVALYAPVQTMVVQRGVHGFQVKPNASFRLMDRMWMEP
jgi:peptide/nickel transport system substrate-binding protein